MRTADYFAIALRNILLQKRRTCYTVIGIALGSMMLITLLSFGAGLKSIVWEQVEMDPYFRSIYILDEEIGKDDLRAMKTLQGVVDVVHFSKLDITKSKLGQYQLYRNTLIGWELDQQTVSTGLFQRNEVRQVKVVEHGRFFREDEVFSAIVGKKYLEAMEITDYKSIIGTKISLIFEPPMGQWGKGVEPRVLEAEIVGIANELVFSDQILVPTKFTSLVSEYYQDIGSPLTNYRKTIVFTNMLSSVEQVEHELHGLGYRVETPKEAIIRINNAYSILNTVLWIFGLIILIAANFGVVNTMMMAFYERMHSIGIWKAIGASKRVIRRLFLLETAYLGGVGWLIGVVLSFLNIQVLDMFLGKVLTSNNISTDIHLNISPNLILVSILTTIVVAVLAALFPSNRAAKLEIVKILSYE